MIGLQSVNIYKNTNELSELPRPLAMLLLNLSVILLQDRFDVTSEIC